MRVGQLWMCAITCWILLRCSARLLHGTWVAVADSSLCWFCSTDFCALHQVDCHILQTHCSPIILPGCAT